MHEINDFYMKVQTIQENDMRMIKLIFFLLKMGIIIIDEFSGQSYILI